MCFLNSVVSFANWLLKFQTKPLHTHIVHGPFRKRNDRTTVLHWSTRAKALICLLYCKQTERCIQISHFFFPLFRIVFALVFFHQIVFNAFKSARRFCILYSEIINKMRPDWFYCMDLPFDGLLWHINFWFSYKLIHYINLSICKGTK